MSSEKLEKSFPALVAQGYRITSEATVDYNCIAWAIEKDNLVWWPDTMSQFAWPEKLSREESLDVFVAFFRRFGYEACQNGEFEQGFEKVALYRDEHGRGSHAAKQLQSGKWTSKLGGDEDIEHNTLDALVGMKLGYVGQILKRPIFEVA
ncbi:MAG: hypothetical protein EXS63_07265 [Candidatus Omnitrophica bacterium]|nr:hypothetical protein [Candidatus Omnitrophota bacterium]